MILQLYWPNYQMSIALKGYKSEQIGNLLYNLRGKKFDWRYNFNIEKTLV